MPPVAGPDTREDEVFTDQLANHGDASGMKSRGRPGRTPRAASYATLLARARRAERYGRLVEANALYELALHCFPRDAERGDAPALLRRIARTCQRGGTVDRGVEGAELALAVAEAHGEPRALVHALSLMAGVRLHAGELDDAEALFVRALDAAQACGDPACVAMASRNLGIVAALRGRTAEALAHYDHSLALYHATGHPSQVAAVLLGIGRLHMQSRCWDDAAVACDDAMRVAAAAGDRALQLDVEVQRAELWLATGGLADARSACVRAIAIAAQLRHPRGDGAAHRLLGVVEREDGDLASAERHLRRAGRIATTHHDPLLLADVTKEQAELHRQAGRHRSALQCLERARNLYSHLRAPHELADVGRRTERLGDDLMHVARRWGQSIECRDEYTQGHSERVADIACALAAADGMQGASLRWLRIGALLHDVGKLMLPAELLTKCGALTVEEWVEMRRHPVEGVRMLANVDFPAEVRPIVESHHERWDGTGYPHGLAGESIPRVARIACIADVYDALTSERSYKPALSHVAAMETMRIDVGRQFDPELFARFELVAMAYADAWATPASASAAPPPHHLDDDAREPFATDPCRIRLCDERDHESARAPSRTAIDLAVALTVAAGADDALLRAMHSQVLALVRDQASIEARAGARTADRLLTRLRVVRSA
jgi:putative nucleotidyltransferase with HDIG domain